MRRVLQVVKTSDGASWAAQQAKVLNQLGIEVHVALPSEQGEAIVHWRAANAKIHILDCSLSLNSPHSFPRRIKQIQNLVHEVQPDLIHSHFVTTSIMLRLALKDLHIPRVFQVPGPLHLEHQIYRSFELATAKSVDFWIASSRYIKDLYLKNGVHSEKLYLSYYGTHIHKFGNQGHLLSC